MAPLGHIIKGIPEEVRELLVYQAVPARFIDMAMGTGEVSAISLNYSSLRRRATSAFLRGVISVMVPTIPLMDPSAQ
jgi:hypothetical protein